MMKNEKEYRHSSLKKGLYFILALWFVSHTAFCSDAKIKDKKTSSVLLDKPYFTLRLEMKHCAFAVRFNGVTVFRDMEASPITLEVPINHWVRTGDNEITLSLYTFSKHKPLSPKAECHVKLQVRPDGTPHEDNLTLSTLSYLGKMAPMGQELALSTRAGRYDSKRQLVEDKEGGDVRIGTVKVISPIPDEPDEAGKIFTQTVTMPTPFPEWAFFKSDDLPSDINKMPEEEFQKYRNSLFAEYKKIHQALKNKNVEPIIPLLMERNQEIDQAFYKQPGTTEKEVLAYFKRSLSDNNLELDDKDIKAEYYAVFTHSNKKLVKLETDSDQQVIAFFFKGGGGSTQHEIILRRKNNKWIITR